jgi:hypothetical protein
LGGINRPIDCDSTNVKGPCWESAIAQKAECLVCDLSEKGLISIDGIPLQFHAIDRTVMRLARLAYEKSTLLAIFYPSIYTDILPYVALESVYASYQKQCPNRVLVIPRDLEARAIYQQLATSGGKIHTMLHPAGMVHRNGDVTAFSGSKFEPKILFSSSPSMLPLKAKNIGTVIFEPEHNTELDEIDQVIAWSKRNNIKSLVFIETNPYSPRYIEYKKRNIPIWGWDLCSLKRDFYSDSNLEALESGSNKSEVRQITEKRIQNLVSASSYRVLFLPSSELDTYLERIWKTCEELKRLSIAEKNESLFEVSRWLRMAYYTLCDFIVPGDLLERNLRYFYPFRTIRSRIDQIQNLESRLDVDGTLVSLISTAIQYLNESYRLLNNSTPPKSRALIQCIETAVASNRSLLIIAPNIGTKYAIERYLAEKMDRDIDAIKSELKFEVITRSELRDASFHDVCIFTAALPLSRIDLMTAAVAPRIGFLVHKAEIDSVKNLARFQYTWLNQRYSYDIQISTLCKITGENQSIFEELVPRPNKSELSATILVGEDEISVSSIDTIAEEALFLKIQGEMELESDEDLVLASEDYPEDLELNTDNQDQTTIVAIKIDFESRLWIKLRPRSEVFVIGRRSHVINNILAEEVEIGDTMLITDKGAMRSLEEHTLSVLKRDPRMLKHVGRAEKWVDVLNQGMQHYGHSFINVLTLLKTEGSTITSPYTIYQWSRGYVIGPRDGTDLKRLATLYNDEYLLRDTGKTEQSIKILRGIHHKVKKIIETAVARKTVGSSVDDGLIDKDLNIYWEDFTRRIQFKRVISVAIENETPVTQIGVLGVG